MMEPDGRRRTKAAPTFSPESEPPEKRRASSSEGRKGKTRFRLEIRLGLKPVARGLSHRQRERARERIKGYGKAARARNG